MAGVHCEVWGEDAVLLTVRRGAVALVLNWQGTATATTTSPRSTKGNCLLSTISVPLLSFSPVTCMETWESTTLSMARCGETGISISVGYPNAQHYKELMTQQWKMIHTYDFKYGSMNLAEWIHDKIFKRISLPENGICEHKATLRGFLERDSHDRSHKAPPLPPPHPRKIHTRCIQLISFSQM